MFWVLKRDGSFEYPQHMFWLRNKKIIFLLHTLNSRPEYCNDILSQWLKVTIAVSNDFSILFFSFFFGGGGGGGCGLVIQSSTLSY